VANTLAYYDTATVMVVKSVIIQAQTTMLTNFIVNKTTLKLARDKYLGLFVPVSATKKKVL